MNIEPFFDRYELRARIAPSLIVVLPLVFVVYGLLDALAGGWLSLLGAGSFAVAGIYGISFIVRHLGKQSEAKLWAEWGGEPSVRFARWSDTRFGTDLKKQIHQAVASRCGIELLDAAGELRNPKGADGAIRDAFQRVRGILRREDRDGLWFSHNCEYGFVRNLYGSRWLFATTGVMSAAASGILWWIGWGTNWGVVASTNVALTIVAIVVGWVVLPRVVRGCADRYGESSWTSFLSVASRGSG